MTRHLALSLLTTVTLTAGLLAAPSAQTNAVTPTASARGAQSATVVRWSDGDTVVTDLGAVRLIGIDTPELGSCGARKAKRLAKRWAPKGSRIRLGNPSSVSDLDAYDRMLRYVKAGRSDIGLRQVKKGAQARYDGLDGYDEHPRQKRYRKADRNHPDHCTKTTGADKKSYPPASTSSCPKKAPIKGNRGTDEWIYHLPGQDYYDVTNPEECFASEAGAQKHGYRRART